jgi:hypothetical protein
MGTKNRSKSVERTRAAKRKRAAKRSMPRRGSRPADPWPTVEVFDGGPVGPDVETASLEDVMAAMATVPEGLDWAELADEIVPLFQRLRPYHPSMPEPVRMVVPPGLSIGFGVDIGPAFLNVTPDMLERWGRTTDEVLRQAMANLERRMAAVSADDLYVGEIEELPMRWLQSPTGAASTYVLLPEALGRILGRHRQLLLAPMRNLLISIPAGASRELAAWLFEELASQDPNCLAPAAYLVGDGRLQVEPLGEPFGQA